MPFGIKTILNLAMPSISPSLLYLGTMIDAKFLKEYRCKVCNKLLGKGFLADKESFLEVKCRGCGTICEFTGEDARILKTRSELLKKGLIPDTE